MAVVSINKSDDWSDLKTEGADSSELPEDGVFSHSSKLKALQENLASFEMMTEWVDAADVPPPHAFVTAF